MKNLFCLLLFLFVSQIFSQNIDKKIIERIIIESLPIDGPGGTLLITKGDEKVYEKSFGFADMEKNIKNDVNTVYQIGSISKQFTAAGIMLLVEDGKLSLSDTLTKFITDFPSPAEKVTIENLLLHNSGIKNFTAIPEWLPNWDSKRSLEEVIELVKNKEFDFQPGEKFLYNNTGYAILALIIEKISGKKYGDFLKENIFDPLKLKNTRHGGSKDDIGFRAKGYSLDIENKVIKPAVFTEFPQLSGAGSLISTTDDIAKWINVIKQRKLLKEESWEEFLSPKIKNSFSDEGYYGYGIGIDNYHGHKLFWHTGGMAGFLTAYYYYPEEDIEIIWLGNTDFVNSSSVVRQISNYIFGVDEEKRVAADLPEEKLKNYEGIFLNSIIKLNARLKNNKLELKAVDLPFNAVNFIPAGENEFYAEGQYGVYLTFNNENEILYNDVGQKMKFYREGTQPVIDTLVLAENELKIYEGVFRFAPGNDMNVFIEDGKLKAVLPGQPKYTLLPIGKNEFMLENLDGFKMIFKLNETGEVESVTSSQPNGDFKAEKISSEVKKPKVNDGIKLSKDELKKFEGEYEFAPGNVMKVRLEKGNLKAEISNQPVYTLIPVAENEFKLDELEGFKMIFEVNDKDEVIRVTSHQPNGKYKAVKK